MYEFYINKYNTLMCNEISKETKILENVSKFNINITYLGIIEVVCITYDGFIKYCKFNKKWSTQTLYKLKSHNNSIDEVNLFSKGNKLHIFLCSMKIDMILVEIFYTMYGMEANLKLI